MWAFSLACSPRPPPTRPRCGSSSVSWNLSRPTTPSSVGLPLPEQLPSRTYVVVTHRPGSYPPTVRAGSGTRIETLVIAADADDQLADVRDYLRHRATRDLDVIAALGRANPPLAADKVVDLLATASDGNFMYAAYALDDLASGAAPSLADPTMPRGLAYYYRRIWDTMAAGALADTQQWQRLHGPVIAHLAVAGEPVTLQWLADHPSRRGGGSAPRSTTMATVLETRGRASTMAHCAPLVSGVPREH